MENKMENNFVKEYEKKPNTNITFIKIVSLENPIFFSIPSNNAQIRRTPLRT